MPTLPNGTTQLLALLDTLVFNPGNKFISMPDKENAVNAAALYVANQLGGIFYIDQSLTTDATNTRYFIVPNNIYRIEYLELVDQTVTPESTQVIDVIPLEQARAINSPQTSEAVFAYFHPDSSELHFTQDLPPNRVIRMLAFGMPNFISISGGGGPISLDSNVDQMQAIAYEAASILRTRTRDVEESQALHMRAVEYIESAAKANSARRQVSKLAVGRHTPLTRLRRF